VRSREGIDALLQIDRVAEVLGLVGDSTACLADELWLITEWFDPVEIQVAGATGHVTHRVGMVRAAGFSHRLAPLGIG
jgi:hypothetical protein